MNDVEQCIFVCIEVFKLKMEFCFIEQESLIGYV